MYLTISSVKLLFCLVYLKSIDNGLIQLAVEVAISDALQLKVRMALLQ